VRHTDTITSELGANKAILSLATKFDKPDAMSLDEIRIGLSKATSGRLVSIFRVALTEKGLETTGLPEAFDWLNLALEIAKPSQTASVIPKDPQPAPPNLREQSFLSDKLESWLTRIETDLDPEEFHTKFRSFTLPSWDHYTHIRIAYIMLTKFGRKEGTVYLRYLLTLLFGTIKSDLPIQEKIGSFKASNSTSPPAIWRKVDLSTSP